MKLRAAILILSFGCAASAGAQNSAAQVNDAQIKEYKAVNEKACREAGTSRGDPPETVTEFCKCITALFEKSLSREDWQRAYFFSKQGRQADERNVYGPHESKLRTCSQA